MNQTNAQNQTDSPPTLADVHIHDQLRMTFRPTEDEEIEVHGEETECAGTVTAVAADRFIFSIYHGDILIVNHDGTVQTKGTMFSDRLTVATDAAITRVIKRGGQ